MKTNKEPPDEIEALLPWYATGRLSAEDRARVAAALAGDAGLARQMRLIEEDRQATILLNEDLGAPGSDAWERIAAVVASEPRRPARSARFARWLGLTPGAPPRRLAWVGGATIVIMLQSMAIFALRPSSGGFHTASAPPAAATSAQALVAFAPETRLDQVGNLLGEVNGAIVEGPRGGFYEIRFGAAPLDRPALDALLAKLRASAFVKMAVPMRPGG